MSYSTSSSSSSSSNFSSNFGGSGGVWSIAFDDEDFSNEESILVSSFSPVSEPLLTPVLASLVSGSFSILFKYLIESKPGITGSHSMILYFSFPDFPQQ